ncbi:MAG: hypothetical protein N2645_10505 [Clostridia bacterium]|nr:hypothetical protein [Clostridia bacterium]
MRKKSNLMILLFILIYSFLLNSCSNSNVNKTQQNKVVEQNINQDKELTKELKKEEIVADGQVYLQEDTVTLAMIIKEGIEKEKVQPIAQKYAEILRNKYKDKKINVQAARNGENLASVYIE